MNEQTQNVDTGKASVDRYFGWFRRARISPAETKHSILLGNPRIDLTDMKKLRFLYLHFPPICGKAHNG